MDDLRSKLSVAGKPLISPELRAERKVGSRGFSGTVFKESRNRTDTQAFTEKSRISSSHLRSERKIGSGSSGSFFKGPSNISEAFTEISPSELELEREIGSGGFGRVFKGSWNKTKVAIKVFNLEGSMRPRRAAIQKEVETWAKLRHPHVLQFLGADIKGEDPFIVMPYLENGNARDYIKRYPECNRNKILYGVTLALVYLHGRNVVHGDIKGFNVLIDIANNAVLCDFGIALIKDDVLSTSLNSRERSMVGTPSFMAPERLKGGSLRKPCDVYAFGMLIYEVHANANPLNLHIGYSEFMKVVAIEGHRPERPDRDEAPQLTDTIWRLAERCWEGTPSARPPIGDVSDTIAPSVELYDSYPANTATRDGDPKRSDGDEAPQMTDDIGHLAERTATARPSMDDVCDTIVPSIKLYGDYPANAVPLSGGSSTHIQNHPPSAYDRLQAGATFRETLAIRTPCKYLLAVAITHDGKTIASAGRQMVGGVGVEGTIQIWDATSGVLIASRQVHEGRVRCLVFFNNGSLVSGSNDHTVQVWNLASSAMVILKHDDVIGCISLSTDNKTVASATRCSNRYDGSVRLWDATTGCLLHTLKNPKCTNIDAISISPDTSSLVALGNDRRLQNSSVSTRWKQQPNGRWVVVVSREYPFQNSYQASASCSSTSLRFALSKDDRLVIYDLYENEVHVDEGFSEVTFSPDGNWLVGTAVHGTTTPLKIYDAASGKILSVILPSCVAFVRDVFVSHDGSTILAGDNGFVRILVLTDP